MSRKLQTHPYRGRLREHPGKLNLLLSGFQLQDIIRTEHIVEAIEALPRSHIEGLQVIKYDPFRTVQQAYAWESGKPPSPHLMGAYYHAPDLAGIVLYRFTDEETFYHMLYHEIGHYVHMRIITQALREHWAYTIRPAHRQYVSRYAARNAAEDFAECYAYFCVHPKVLAQIPEKMRFMAEDIFYLDPGTYAF